MARILVLINSISHTSIPFELSVRVAETTDAEIVVMSFYDKCPDDIDITEGISDLPVDVRTLGGTSRFDQDAWTAFEHELSMGYDLVHTHHNFSGSVARIFAKLRGVPVVNTEHRDHGSYSLPQNLVNAPTLPLANKVVSNSQVTQDSFRWYERAFLDDDQLEVIYNGVDLERIERVVGSTNRPKDETIFRICTVGRMVPVKNQSTLLQAFRSVVDHFPQAELLLIGDGPLRANLESLAWNLGITDNIEFTGVVPRKRVYELYAQSDIFVMPSYAEGFCVAAVEAMAAELPILASDIPVFHEVIGKCGIYVDPDHPEEFTDKIKQLLESKKYRDKQAEKCCFRARNKYSLDQTAEEYYKLYQQVARSSN